MLGTVEVRASLEKGFPLVCATCDHFREAKERGLPRCTSPTKTCVGPPGGGVFHDYKGPLDLTSGSFCFVDGDPAVKAISVAVVPKGLPPGLQSLTHRKFGLCTNHVSLLDTERPDPQDHFDPEVGYEKRVEAR